MADVNKIKGHPGFMPFGCSNVKSSNAETQSQRDARISKEEAKKDKSSK